MPRKPPEDGTGPSAYRRALGLLARREHSARELAAKLAARGHASEEADAALAALRRQDYLNDARFAEAILRQRIAAGYGPRHIEAEWRAHGLVRDDLVEARQELAAIDWSARARALLRRRHGSLTADPAARRRAMQYLARRGFPSDAVRAATGVDIADEDS